MVRIMASSMRKNTVFSGLTNLSDLLQFVLTVIAANKLNAHGFGMFNTALSLSMTFMAFSDLGLNYLAIRNVARDRSSGSRLLGNFMAWRSVLTAITFGLLLLTARYFWSDDPELQPLVLVLGLSMVLRFFSLAARYFLQGLERFDIESLSAATEQLLLVGVGIAVLMLNGGVMALAWVFFVTRVIGSVMALGMLHRIMPLRWRLEPSYILPLQREALPIGLAFGMVMACVHIDTIILSRMTSHADVGIYNSAFRIYAGLFVVANAICSVLMPRLSDTFHRGDRVTFRRLFFKGSGVLLLISAATLTAGWLAAPLIIRLLYTREYLAAIPLMKILFWTCVPSFQIWLLRVALMATNRQMAFMFIYVIGLAVRVAADILLIRRFGIAGAAWAALASETFVCVAIAGYLVRSGVLSGKAPAQGQPAAGGSGN
jgi:O-antigen/teichoic acid export membrane protein